MSLEDIAKSAGISRQTLHLLLNHGKGTITNLITVLRSINELERLSSLLEEVLPSPLQIIRMEGKNVSGHRGGVQIQTSFPPRPLYQKELATGNYIIARP